MTDFKSTIGSASTRRRVAGLIALIGVTFVGSQLASLWPREVETLYEVGPGVRELDIDYLQGGEAVASVRFGQTASKTSVFRHVVRLQPGEYQVHITLYGQDGSASEHGRQLAVPADGVTRFDLEAATGSPE